MPNLDSGMGATINSRVAPLGGETLASGYFRLYYYVTQQLPPGHGCAIKLNKDPPVNPTAANIAEIVRELDTCGYHVDKVSVLPLGTEIPNLDCTESYVPQTLEQLTGKKSEVLGFSLEFASPQGHGYAKLRRDANGKLRARFLLETGVNSGESPAREVQQAVAEIILTHSFNYKPKELITLTPYR